MSAPVSAVEPSLGQYESPMRQGLRRFRSNRPAILGGVVLALVLGIAIFAPTFAQDPNHIDLEAIRQPPSGAHLLGTDEAGRDVWSRLVYGAQTSMIVGFGAVALYVVIGTILGMAAGYFGGSVDQILMRVTDTVMSIPPLLLIIVFVAAVGPSLASVIAVIGLLGWPGTARLVRGQFLSLREAEFVTAARVTGVRDLSIAVRHLLPNTLGPLTVVATFGVASAILLEAGLSFLGLGVRPPAPSWGVMINSAQSPVILNGLPWLWLPPGIAIAVTVLAVNFIGDGLRDAFDPRAGARR
jgi:peptide/nickel transport system permease protein